MSLRSIESGWRPARARWSGGLLVVLATLFVAGCINIQGGDGAFVLGGSIDVPEGETARDDLVAVGGSIRIDGTARRDVVNIGGTLIIEGRVGRDVVSVGGSTRLGEDAEIDGNLTVVGGGLSRHPDARIDGETVNVSFGPGIPVFNFGPGFGSGWWGWTPFMLFGRVTQLLYWLLLALLCVALVGDRVSSASHAISREPLRLGAIGFVALIAMFLGACVLAVLSIFLIGIPFLLALIFGWVLAYIFGVVATFQAVGGRVVRIFGKPDASQIGIVLAGALLLGFLRFLPAGFGSLIWFLAALIGFGSVFATRFGTGRPWLRRDVPPPPGPQEPQPGGGPEPSQGPVAGQSVGPAGTAAGASPASGQQRDPTMSPPAGPAEPLDEPEGYSTTSPDDEPDEEWTDD